MAKTAKRVREYRARKRAQGLRQIQLWVPDTRTESFIDQARQQSRAVAGSDLAGQDQAFVDEISDYA